MKSIRISFLSGIQLSDPLLLEIDFSLQEGVTRIMLAKFHQIPRFWKFSVNFYRNSTHRKFPEF
jgi:hypothetical protein